MKSIRFGVEVLTTAALISSSCSPLEVIVSRIPKEEKVPPQGELTPTSILTPGGVTIPFYREVTATPAIGSETVTPEPATATATPENTPVPEVVELTPGMVVGPEGLWRNLDTGANQLAPNPEADWAGFRKYLIEGLWIANVKQHDFDGFETDATKYKTAEEFMAVADSGVLMKIGIPVRQDLSGIKDLLPSEDPRGKAHSALEMEPVEIYLDEQHPIQLQILPPDVFKKVSGKGFYELGNKAFQVRQLSLEHSANVTLFQVDKNGSLVFSVGSLFFGTKQTTDTGFRFGARNPEFYDKYSSLYFPDGMGVRANDSATYAAVLAAQTLHEWGVVQTNYLTNGTEFNYICPKVSWRPEQPWIVKPLIVFPEKR